MVYVLRRKGQLLPRYKVFSGSRGWRYEYQDIETFLKRHTFFPEVSVQELRPFVPVELPRIGSMTTKRKGDNSGTSLSAFYLKLVNPSLVSTVDTEAKTPP